MRDWISFIATVISPFLLGWFAFVGSQVEKRVEEHNHDLDRLYNQQQDAVKRQDELAKAQIALTKQTLPDLSNKNDADARRLAVMTMLAYVDRRAVPPFMLSVLAIQESREDNSNNHITDDLRTALVELSEVEKDDEIRVAATRALILLPRFLNQTPTEKDSNEHAVTQLATKVDAVSKDTSSVQNQTTARTQLAALVPALTTIAITGQNRTSQQKAISVLADTEVSADVIEHAISEAAKLSPTEQNIVLPRVYIHIASEDQRKAAKVLQSQLIAKNYIVPGIENVSGKAKIPAKLQVRYFDPQAKESADSILQLIKNGGIDGELDFEKPSGGDATSSDIKTHFEVWAASSSIK